MCLYLRRCMQRLLSILLLVDFLVGPVLPLYNFARVAKLFSDYPFSKQHTDYKSARAAEYKFSIPKKTLFLGFIRPIRVQVYSGRIAIRPHRTSKLQIIKHKKKLPEINRRAFFIYIIYMWLKHLFMLYLHYLKRFRFCAYIVFSILRELDQGIFLGQTLLGYLQILRELQQS